MLGAAAQQHRDRLRLGATGQEGHIGLTDFAFFDAGSVAKIGLTEVVDVGDHTAAGGLGQGLHVGLLGTANGEHARLGEVMLRKVVDALLANHDVGARGADGFHQTTDVPLLFLQEGGQLVGVGDLNLRVHLGLLDLDGRVDEGDTPLGHHARHAGVNAFLVEDDAVNKRAVTDGTALALFDLDVVKVNEALVVLDAPNGVHGAHADVGEEGLHRAGGLAGKRGLGHLKEHVVVVLGGQAVLVQRVDGVLCGEAEAFANDGGVNVLFDQVLAALEQLTGEHHGRRRAVVAVLLLGLGHLDDHLGRGVFDVHLLEDGCTVVGDDHVTDGVHEHLVHAFGTERRTHGIGHGLRGGDVVRLSGAAAGALGAFLQDEDGCLALLSLVHEVASMLARAGLPSTLRPKPVAVKRGRFVRATSARRSATVPWTTPQASLLRALAVPRERLPRCLKWRYR